MLKRLVASFWPRPIWLGLLGQRAGAEAIFKAAVDQVGKERELKLRIERIRGHEVDGHYAALLVTPEVARQLKTFNLPTEVADVEGLPSSDALKVARWAVIRVVNQVLAQGFTSRPKSALAVYLP